MKYILRRTYLLLLLLTLSLIGSGQDLTQISKTIIPPSPTAYELGKYGLFPISMYTGSVNFTIPIYEMKSRHLDVPISLSYYSNGVKVDQMPTQVGIGWSLNAGGVITRNIRGNSDEKSNVVGPVPPFRDDLSSLTATDQSHLVWNSLDNEPDIFSYNFMGRSGKFVINKVDSTIYTMPYENIKIKNNIINFEVTLEDGTILTFGDIERTQHSNTLDPANFTAYMNTLSSTAYYLSKVKHPAGDSIMFTYKNDTLRYYGGLTHTLSTWTPRPNPVPPVYNPACYTFAYPTFDLSSNGSVPGKLEYDVYGKILTNITYNNISVDFLSSKVRPDLNPNAPNYKDLNICKMDEILIKDSHTGELLRDYSLNYTFSNDTSRMFLTSVSSSFDNKFSFEYDNLNSLPKRLSCAQDHWGFYNGATGNTSIITITREDSLQFKTLFPSSALESLFPSAKINNRNPVYPYSQRGMLAKITFPTGGTTSINYEQNYYLNNSDTIFVGGVRVKRLISCESATATPQIERYYYSDNRNNLRKSTSVTPTKPR